MARVPSLSTSKELVHYPIEPTEQLTSAIWLKRRSSSRSSASPSRGVHHVSNRLRTLGDLSFHSRFSLHIWRLTVDGRRTACPSSLRARVFRHSASTLPLSFSHLVHFAHSAHLSHYTTAHLCSATANVCSARARTRLPRLCISIPLPPQHLSSLVSHPLSLRQPLVVLVSDSVETRAQLTQR